MLTEQPGKLLLKKAVPTVVTQLITIIYNTADTYFVAQISTEASAAVGIVFSLMAIIQALGFGIGMGANSLISRALGAKEDDKANVYASSALVGGLFFGCFILTFGLIFLHPFMRLLGSSENVLPFANEYATYILIAAPFMCMAFVLNNLLRSQGQAFFSMIGMATGGILNMFFDPLLIFTFHMGIRGAAIATMAGQIISAGIMLGFFLKGKSIVRLGFRYISRKFSTYVLILRIGLPTIFRQGLASLATAILNNQTAAYGDAAVAAISIVNKIYMLSRNIVLGIGQGYQPIAGYCFGAGNKKRVKTFFWLSTAAGTTVVILIAISVFLFRENIMTWFRDDPEVIRIGTEGLLYTCIVTPLMGFSTYANQTYQVLGFSAGATFLASCRQGIFYIPLAFILPAIAGLTGIELLQPAADLLTFIVAIPFVVWLFRHRLSENTGEFRETKNNL